MTPAPQPGLSRLRLPAALDARAVDALAGDLLALRGQPIGLDASGVERVGGLGLQVLLAARLTWRSDGLAFAVIDPSEAFRADCTLLGAPAHADPSEGTRP